MAESNSSKLWRLPTDVMTMDDLPSLLKRQGFEIVNHAGTHLEVRPPKCWKLIQTNVEVSLPSRTVKLSLVLNMNGVVQYIIYSETGNEKMDMIQIVSSPERR